MCQILFSIQFFSSNSYFEIQINEFIFGFKTYKTLCCNMPKFFTLITLNSIILDIVDVRWGVFDFFSFPSFSFLTLCNIILNWLSRNTTEFDNLFSGSVVLANILPKAHPINITQWQLWSQLKFWHLQTDIKTDVLATHNIETDVTTSTNWQHNYQN